MNLNVMTKEDAARIADAVKATDKPADEIAEEARDRPPGETPQVAADDLYSQVLKYVPTPLIGLYLIAVNAALSSFDGDAERWALWIIFVLFALAVIAFMRTRKVHRVKQIAVSLGAFVAWVAASPGPFQAIKDYPEVMGTFALLAVALAATVFQLKPLPDEAVDKAKP